MEEEQHCIAQNPSPEAEAHSGAASWNKASEALGRELSRPGSAFQEERHASVPGVQCSSAKPSPEVLTVNLDYPEVKAQALRAF